MSLWTIDDNTWFECWRNNHLSRVRPLAKLIVNSMSKGEPGRFPSDTGFVGRYASICIPDGLYSLDFYVDFVAEFLLSYYRPGMTVRWYTVKETWSVECWEGE